MFNRGDRVTHINHGYGQIIKVVSDTEVECFFKNGMVDGGRGKLWATVPKSFLKPMPKPETALSKMVEKLDNKRPGTSGYVTYRDEIVDILSELSKLVPANVFLEKSPFENEVQVTIKVSFTLERDLL
jgi:hypothetical protein